MHYISDVAFPSTTQINGTYKIFKIYEKIVQKYAKLRNLGKYEFFMLADS